VRASGLMMAITGAGGLALSLAIAPAINAALSGQDVLKDNKVSLKMLGSIGSFTPVTRDQRLAEVYAEAAREAQTRGFRFTPASGALNGERSLTVLVRAHDSGAAESQAKRGTPNLGLAPVAYNLGKAKGLNRFADGTAAAREDEDGLTPIVDSLQLPDSNFDLKAKSNRFSTNLQLESRRQRTAAAPTSGAPLASEKSYAVDLSSSYALTRNLDVQAGVRYRGPENRLVPLTDQAQDSQAVYVGTKFKF